MNRALATKQGLIVLYSNGFKLAISRWTRKQQLDTEQSFSILSRKSKRCWRQKCFCETRGEVSWQVFLECTCEPSGDREGNKVLVRARQETALWLG